MNSYQLKKNLAELARLILILILFSIFVFYLSLVIFLSINNEWSIASYYSNSNLDFFIQTFPSLFLIPLGLSFITSIATYSLSLTKKQISTYKFSVLILVFAFLFSACFYYLGLAKIFNDSYQNESFYINATKNRYSLWSNPEFGFLSGKIGILYDIDDFLLIDFEGKTWRINIDKKDIKNENLIKTDNNIKIIGRIINEKTFLANEIFKFENEIR